MTFAFVTIDLPCVRRSGLVTLTGVGSFLMCYYVPHT